jgi:uncharacterized protein
VTRTTTHPAEPSRDSTDPHHRLLVARPVHRLGGIVGRVPAAVVAIALLLTGGFVVLTSDIEQDTGQDAMLPDAPEVDAAEILAERFGGNGVETMQLLVSTDGDTLIGRDGITAAEALETAILDSAVADHLVDTGQLPVVTWAFPAQQTLEPADRSADDDAAVAEAYRTAMASLPNDQAGLAAALLPEGATGTDADRALVLILLDPSGMDESTYFEQMVEVQTVLADAIATAPLPDGISAEPFSLYLMFAEAGDFDAELGRLFSTAFGIIVLILAFVYWVKPGAALSRRRSGRRSLADVVLSMSAIVMAVMWMMGAAALLGPRHLGLIGPMNQFAQVIPVLLIGLGVDYAIHLTSRYREELGTGASVADASRRAIGTVGAALVLATVTTAVGFLTNLVNPIPALRDFGVLAAVGIVSSFVLMLTFVPAMRLLLDRRAERTGRLPAASLGQSSERLLPELMSRAAVLAERAAIPTLAVTLVLAGLGVFGLTQLETRFSNTDSVPQDSPMLDTLDELTERFNGGLGETTEVLITGEVATPAVHNALVELHAELTAVADVVGHEGQAVATSPVTLFGQLLAAEDGGPASALIDDAVAAAGVQADLTVDAEADVAALYRAVAAAAPEAASQVLAATAEGTYDAVRVAITTTAGEERGGELATALRVALAPFEAAGVTAVATSNEIMTDVIVTALRESQVTSLAITLLVAMLLLVAVFAYEHRRPFLGVLTIAPVVLVVLWTFGMMAATGIPFGPITATIAALAIGIGLPYAIHVTHRFTEDRQRHADAGAAIRATVRHTGGAMAGSAFTTMAGFGILVTSSILPFRQLGAVTVYAVGFSLLAATLVQPSMLMLWDRWHRRRAPAKLDREVDLEDRDATPIHV